MNVKVLSLFCFAMIASITSMPNTPSRPEDLVLYRYWGAREDKKILERTAEGKKIFRNNCE